ncbi:MCE family protein [Mycolicibacterium fluoranthenivorans]|uniref:Phospholipid/cholesterol/gamma-HCH transport system substrate-binding protein n=1 Tax=Mycolicibacterium fluoranthenivorans TaxID=258505 RepID=A0A1G4WGE0_9MYCO|nr:MCE family protein [Mycolicibacterium fluoranthenivorans]SCX21879.1 phospholipid/cholesterol/gamma-HCH transport system substrate-binding protein [Mycolicibacterium fluoranthenivorans]
MAHEDRRHVVRVRVAAACLAVLIAGAAALTYASYTAAFASTAQVTVVSPRAGLVMEPGAKVKYRGIQIGTVGTISYRGDQAQLVLAIDSRQITFIPTNAKVHIGSTTVFGAKSVEFQPPRSPSASRLRPGATVPATSVQLEANTLFENLNGLLQKIEPLNLNATLTAISEGMRGHGDSGGATLAVLNSYLRQINPKLPTLSNDVAAAATMAPVYGDTAPDLTTVLDNLPTLNTTIVDQADNLEATLLATTGLANDATATVSPAADDYIAAIRRLRVPLTVASDYSPEFGCLLQGIAQGLPSVGAIIGGVRPGLFASANFIPGAPAYTYPESLPIVNASGGPNCRGLPNPPTKQNGGSWYHAPFLVTDNAYVPYQPNTETQFNAPSTLQFLFNGAFAEHDDY